MPHRFYPPNIIGYEPVAWGRRVLKFIFICQYHSWWWPGDASSQGTISYDIDKRLIVFTSEYHWLWTHGMRRGILRLMFVCQYHSWWWPGDARSQGTISYGNDTMPPKVLCWYLRCHIGVSLCVVRDPWHGEGQGVSEVFICRYHSWWWLGNARSQDTMSYVIDQCLINITLSYLHVVYLGIRTLDMACENSEGN